MEFAEAETKIMQAIADNTPILEELDDLELMGGWWKLHYSNNNAILISAVKMQLQTREMWDDIFAVPRPKL